MGWGARQMKKPEGLATIFSPTDSVANLTGRGMVEVKEGIFESATTSCGHCQKIIHVPPRAHPNFLSMCRVCMRVICEECSAKGCEPWEKKIEQMEERERTLRSYGV